MDSEKPKRANGCSCVIAIAIGLLLIGGFFVIPAFMRAPQVARIAEARYEMANLTAAISQYEASYGRSPISSNAIGSPDFTFGTFGTSDTALGITNDSGYQANNSEVMAIIMDITRFRDGRDTVNADHSLNPSKIVCLNVRETSDTNCPGLGPDGVLRDPWGHPYIITIDLNGDKKCRDAFYKLASVSEKASALGSKTFLVRPTPPPYNSDDARDSFEIPNASVTVWSFGPDGKADKTQKANEGVNKDNITSW